MKTSLIVPATLALVVGVVGLSQASPAERAGSATTQTTKAPALTAKDLHCPTWICRRLPVLTCCLTSC